VLGAAVREISQPIGIVAHDRPHQCKNPAHHPLDEEDERWAGPPFSSVGRRRTKPLDWADNSAEDEAALEQKLGSGLAWAM
jgi:hypothetical protein